MRTVAQIFLLGLVCSAAQAQPLTPVKGGAVDGIPLAQALATMQTLDAWRLASGGQLRLSSVMTREGGECGVSDMDDANICPRFTLLLSVNGETAVPVDFALFRLPETLGWKIPKGAVPVNDFGKFSIPLAACEMKQTSKGFTWKGQPYILHVTEALQDQLGGAHYVFTADLQKSGDERDGCGA